jgi:hypothetical protein
MFRDREGKHWRKRSTEGSAVWKEGRCLGKQGIERRKEEN